jgi:hypothetical protein
MRCFVPTRTWYALMLVLAAATACDRGVLRGEHAACARDEECGFGYTCVHGECRREDAPTPVGSTDGSSVPDDSWPYRDAASSQGAEPDAGPSPSLRIDHIWARAAK